jgi:hypothetical protein
MGRSNLKPKQLIMGRAVKLHPVVVLRGGGRRGSAAWEPSGRSTGGSLTVIEIIVGQGPPKHTQTQEDERLYIFTGAL